MRFPGELFAPPVRAYAPLAERMRPQSLDDLLGQQRWLGPNGFLRTALQADRLPSLILWGPPGVGKTTIARLVATHGKARFAALSAVLDGVANLRAAVVDAEKALRHGEQTVLFVDEIHRFNKSQQDALLPHVENGTVALIGATTENPGFSLTSALLSRCALVVLEPLAVDDLKILLNRALRDDRGYAQSGLTADEDALHRLCQLADGDARRALTSLELVAELVLAQAASDPTQTAHIDQAVVDKAPLQAGARYDRDGDLHHQVISAFIKSLRGSDPDAAIYYLARMLDAGEDPRFICRRLIVFAAEDVGNADAQALQLAVAAAQAHEMCGLPESRIMMAHATTYLACAPKSKASYLALAAAQQALVHSGSLSVPESLRNPTTSLTRDLGWGKDYQDPHAAGGWVPGHYLPEKLQDKQFYQPTRNGGEGRIADRLQTWRQLRRDKDKD